MDTSMVVRLLDAGMLTPAFTAQRPLEPDGWSAPEEVGLRAGRLTWSRRGPRQRVECPDDLLDRFMELAGASDQAVADFAKRYGLLLLCEEHGLPLSHLRTVGVDAMVPCNLPGGRKPYVGVEWYRELARLVNAVLKIAARLHRDTHGDSSDWEIVYPPMAEPLLLSNGHFQLEPATPDEQLTQERALLADLIDHWLDLSDARLRLEWDDQPSFRIQTDSLYGAVTVSLMLAVARRGLALCRTCGALYAPIRMPKAGQRNYCGNCQGTRHRDAKRDQRAKARQAAAKAREATIGQSAEPSPTPERTKRSTEQVSAQPSGRPRSNRSANVDSAKPTSGTDEASGTSVHTGPTARTSSGSETNRSGAPRKGAPSTPATPRRPPRATGTSSGPPRKRARRTSQEENR